MQSIIPQGKRTCIELRQNAVTELVEVLQMRTSEITITNQPYYLIYQHIVSISLYYSVD